MSGSIGFSFDYKMLKFLKNYLRMSDTGEDHPFNISSDMG